MLREVSCGRLVEVQRAIGMILQDACRKEIADRISTQFLTAVALRSSGTEQMMCFDFMIWRMDMLMA